MNVVVIIGTGGMGVASAMREGPGNTVVLADRDEQALDATAADLSGRGFDVVPVVVDVADKRSVVELATRAAELGPITKLVHTAGLSPAQANITAILSVDLLGVVHVLDAFESMMAPGGAGVIIASMAAHFGATDLTAGQLAQLRVTGAAELLGLDFLHPEVLNSPGRAYSVAKIGDVVRVQSSSIGWGRRGARVNSISPGVIATPMGREELAGDAGAQMRHLVSLSGTGRIGTASDVASAVSFLLSDHASFITGTDLLVDGGVVGALRASIA